MRFEFGDLYRFMVSAGIALVAVSALVPWLFFREPLDVLVTSENVAALSEESQKILATKQRYVSIALSATPFVSTFLFLSGVALSIFGMRKWSRIQVVDDESRQVALDTARLQLSDMSISEINEKLDEEALEEFNYEPSATDRATFVEDYQSVEKSIFDRVVRIASQSHSVLAEQKIGKSVIDILMKAKMKDGIFDKDYLLEIKVRRRKVSYSDLKSAYMQLRRTAAEYGEFNGVRANSKLIFVVNEENWDPERFALLKAQIMSENRGTGKHVISGMSSKELLDLSDTEFWERI